MAEDDGKNAGLIVWQSLNEVLFRVGKDEIMRIIIDADACPKNALQICSRLGEKYAVPVWTVASFNHAIHSDHHITVGDGDQETDLKIMNITEPGDVVVTQDWGLAAAILGRNAYCLNPGGKEYTKDTIDFLLEERAAKARYRRGGGRTKGPGKRSAENDHHFAAILERYILHDPGRS